MDYIELHDFPDDIKIHMDIIGNTKYWINVLSAVDSKKDIVNLVRPNIDPDLNLDKLNTVIDNGKDIKSKDKISGYVSVHGQDAMIPLSYFRLFEEVLGVQYYSVENNIMSYGPGSNAKVFTYSAGKRMVPIPFDAELILALSSVL
ncbi:MAG: hypothetical protein K0B07_05930 [DPANN group archaeon]|nr:hypothetical protein [DPANN group archaeon]